MNGGRKGRREERQDEMGERRTEEESGERAIIEREGECEQR